eukprot:TRINITY_DN2896_c0_g1_i1.p1 TRINITY_DN2896_c0_g1~~TRINITY_DN2896_c0_g1_i1.p1  ORF type:complete len:464 (+),score=149.22 TRINITY_DN2896_c0_g1_i1:40-1392(+)
MSAQFRENAIRLTQEAIAADNQTNLPVAREKYNMAAQYFLEAIKREKNKNLKQVMAQKVDKVMTRIQEIDVEISKGQKKVPVGGPKKKNKKDNKKNNGKSNNDDQDDDDEEEEEDEETQRLTDMLSDAILQEKPNIKWEDVAGLELVKSTLREAVILPARFPQFYQDVEPWKGILLYGPPGTGKSYLAKAVATECDATFFSVTASTLMSRWQGESEKLVKGLFDLAAKKSPSIIFIDEIDSLCGSRSENDSESSRRVKNEFLVRMNGVGSDMEGVLMLAATNLPWQLDSAMRRRFPKKILIPLPDFEARLAMFKIHTRKVETSLTEEDFVNLANCTDGYSGSDISQVCDEALYGPIRDVQSAAFFKYVNQQHPQTKEMGEWIVPCGRRDAGAFEKNLYEFEKEESAKVIKPAVCFRHFQSALGKQKSSVSHGDLAQYDQWTAEFGMDGSA